MIGQRLVVILFFSLCFQAILTLDNGVGITPAMGFMDWERFRCNIDCSDFPDECISEQLFMQIADAMVQKGLAAAGYVYVSIDDCWMSKERTADGKLQPDPIRFPSGMASLAQYMHERGLKLGIYEDFGTLTCMGYPGSEGYEEVDAETFAQWGVDMLKFDGCYSNNSAKQQGYIKMGEYLNATGRPILYACSWPAYISNPNYTVITDVCNQWRNEGDIQDSFDSVMSIINVYATKQDEYAQYNGPGHFNDPDELLLGDGALSIGQQKIQMSVWCMWSAPLLISSDLRVISDESLAVLLNQHLIDIDQDPLGDFGKRVFTNSNNDQQVWVKKLSGKNDSQTVGGSGGASVNALCLFNVRTDDQTVIFNYTLQMLGIEQPSNPDTTLFNLFDVFTQSPLYESVSWNSPLMVQVEAYEVATLIVIELDDDKDNRYELDCV